MPNTKPYNKEEVMKEFEELLSKNNDWNCGLLPEEIIGFLSTALTLAEQAGEERMKKPLREALGILEDEIPYTSEEVVMHIKEALK